MYKPGQWKMICSVCQTEKGSTEYYLHSNGKPRKQCKTCFTAKILAQPNRQHTNLTATRKYRGANYEKCLQASQKWRKANLEYDAHRTGLYRARRLAACPTWVDDEKLKAVYLGCPDGFHVDHIVPLKGEKVSGLHVPWNLQYLPATENLRKRNHYDL